MHVLLRRRSYYQRTKLNRKISSISYQRVKSLWLSSDYRLLCYRREIASGRSNFEFQRRIPSWFAMTRTKVGQLGRVDEYAYRYDRRYARCNHISEQSIYCAHEPIYVCILTNMQDRFGQGRTRIVPSNRNTDSILDLRHEEINTCRYTTIILSFLRRTRLRKITRISIPKTQLHEQRTRKRKTRKYLDVGSSSVRPNDFPRTWKQICIVGHESASL